MAMWPWSADNMTKAGKERDAKLRELGCIACYVQTGKLGTPASIHHVTNTGRRRGEAYTIPLCNPGHHKDLQAETGKEPFHHNKEAFEAKYGTQDELFDLCNRLLGYTEEEIAQILGTDSVPRKSRKSKPKKKPTSIGRKPPPAPFVPRKKYTPSPEAVARQKQRQADAKKRYLDKNSELLERQKARRKILAADLKKKFMSDKRRREESCCCDA